MASISQIKLPNNSVYDIKAKYDISGNIISDTYLRKDFDSIGHNVSFNSSVDIDDLTAGTLLVTGAARFTNGLIGNLKGTASNVPWSGVTSKPITLSGYGITDALSSSTKYAASDSVGGNALKANLLANLFSSRPTDANVAITGSGGVATFKATSSMTTNRPKYDGHILHFYWDNTAGYDSQLFMSNGGNPELQIRGQEAGTWGAWKTVLSSNNYTDYVPKKDGTGASGTWGISITGNAATATKATSADSATKATQDRNGNVISSTYLPLSGGTITGDLCVMKSITGEPTTTNHRILIGHTNQNYMNFYEFGGLFQFYKSQSGTNTLLGKITSNGWEGNVVGNVTGNASSATKATQDGAGNVITSKYVTIDTTQTISGAKIFSKETTISSATASTSKTTGALKVKGGIASEGQISANKIMIGDKCTLEYDANLQCLNFVFA